MKKSFRGRRLDKKEIRWVVPVQLQLDLKVVAGYMGLNEGEVATMAIQRFMKAFVEEFNRNSTSLQIPDLPSLHGPRLPYSIKEIVEAMLDK